MIGSLQGAIVTLTGTLALYLPAKERQSTVKKLRSLIKKLETQ